MQEPTFIITQAADWKMLAVVGGISWLVVNGIIFLLIARVYDMLPKPQDLIKLRQDINLDIEKLAQRWEQSLEKYSDRHGREQEKDVDNLWNEVRRCQEYHAKVLSDCQRDCCPRGRMKMEPGE